MKQSRCFSMEIPLMYLLTTIKGNESWSNDTIHFITKGTILCQLFCFIFSRFLRSQNFDMFNISGCTFGNKRVFRSKIRKKNKEKKQPHGLSIGDDIDEQNISGSDRPCSFFYYRVFNMSANLLR